MARIETGGELWMASEVQRCAGQLASARGQPAAAEHHDRRAIERAGKQEARLFELRAARDLAWLWAERGERQRAFELLAPVHGWFTEGFDTPDLVGVKALLDALG